MWILHEKSTYGTRYFGLQVHFSRTQITMGTFILETNWMRKKAADLQHRLQEGKCGQQPGYDKGSWNHPGMMLVKSFQWHNDIWNIDFSSFCFPAFLSLVVPGFLFFIYYFLIFFFFCEGFWACTDTSCGMEGHPYFVLHSGSSCIYRCW